MKYFAQSTIIPLEIVNQSKSIAVVRADGSCYFDWQEIEEHAKAYRSGMHNEQHVLIAKLLHGAKLELDAR